MGCVEWTDELQRSKRNNQAMRLWQLLALNFFMADMQSATGPFSRFLLPHGWARA